MVGRRGSRDENSSDQGTVYSEQRTANLQVTCYLDDELEWGHKSFIQSGCATGPGKL